MIVEGVSLSAERGIKYDRKRVRVHQGCFVGVGVLLRMVPLSEGVRFGLERGIHHDRKAAGGCLEEEVDPPMKTKTKTRITLQIRKQKVRQRYCTT